jgi:hypothetical protein
MTALNLTPDAQRGLALLESLGRGSSFQAAATPVGPYLHGPGGIFSAPGLEQGIVNAMVAPQNDLQSALPWFDSDSDNPVFGILTGMTASTGSDAITACATGKTPGNLKLCTQVLPFGEIRMATRAIQLNKIGRQTNRAEMLDPRLIGNPFAVINDSAEMNVTNDLRDEKKIRIAETIFAIGRDYGAWDFSGTPASLNTAGMKQYYGLETQVNTGHVDAIVTPAVTCPAADSYVDTALSTLSWSANAGTIVRRLHDVYRRQVNIAKRTGLDPVTFAFVMRYEHFVEASYYWPCNYFTMGCTLADGALSLNAERTTQMRDDMMNGRFNGRDIGRPYLPIAGVPVPVLFSEFMTETEPVADVFTSDIYLLPMTSPRFFDSNGYITYYQYVNYEKTLGSIGRELINQGRRVMTLSRGRYLLYEIENTGLCYQWGVVTEPRLIVRAPFLAARWTGIRYTNAVPQRSGLPGDANYVNGGIESGYTVYDYNSPLGV